MATIIINAILAPFCGIGIGVSVGFVICKLVDLANKIRMRRLQRLLDTYILYKENKR